MQMLVFPKKIVLSRKGSDSTWGGGPSLIVDNELISLPIPEHGDGKNCKDPSHLRYRHLRARNDIGPYHNYLRLTSHDSCVHLDPDIRPILRSRNQKSPGALGQSGSAARHLINNNIAKNDLFLFFGWYRLFEPNQNGNYQAQGPNQHLIWGWLQVDKVVDLTNRLEKNQLRCEGFDHHPHVYRTKTNSADTLYIARETLSFDQSLPGHGVFRWSEKLCLTQQCSHNSARTSWCVPSFLQKTGLTYLGKRLNEAQRCPENKKRIHLTATGVWQEAIFPSQSSSDNAQNKSIQNWLVDLFEHAEKSK
jgi:hypothetical protein